MALVVLLQQCQFGNFTITLCTKNFTNVCLFHNMLQNEEIAPLLLPEKSVTFFNVSLPFRFIFTELSPIFFNRRGIFISWSRVVCIVNPDKCFIFKTWIRPTAFSVTENLWKKVKYHKHKIYSVCISNDLWGITSLFWNQNSYINKTLDKFRNWPMVLRNLRNNKELTYNETFIPR